MGDRRPRISGRVAVPAEWGIEARMERLETIVQDAVFFGAVREWVDQLARVAHEGRRGGELDELAYADAALGAVQRCGYRGDPAGEDWHQDTATTLREGGDCEDLATALAALLRLGAYFYGLKLKTRLVWLRRTASGQDHVAVQVRVGDGHDTGDDPDGGWEWLDPSLVGARRGEHPEAAARRLGVLR